MIQTLHSFRNCYLISNCCKVIVNVNVRKVWIVFQVLIYLYGVLLSLFSSERNELLPGVGPCHYISI